MSRTARGLPYLLATLFFPAYAAVSIARHRQLRTGGYDLGIFEQAVRSYADLRLPVSEIKGAGFPLLGDHFHPILALLAPPYRLFPGPSTLLVAQAALIAVSVVPVTRLAVDRLGTGRGVAVGVSYGLSWGLLHAVSFDFHEICLAVPLLAASLVRLVERRWASAVAFAAPLGLVKEDLPLTVAAIGGCLVLLGRRRLGAVVAAAGVASTALIMFVVIPALNVYGRDPYLGHRLPLRRRPDAGAVRSLRRRAEPAGPPVRRPVAVRRHGSRRRVPGGHRAAERRLAAVAAGRRCDLAAHAGGHLGDHAAVRRPGRGHRGRTQRAGSAADRPYHRLPLPVLPGRPRQARLGRRL